MRDFLISLKLAVEDILGCVYALTMLCGMIFACGFLMFLPGLTFGYLLTFIK